MLRKNVSKMVADLDFNFEGLGFRGYKFQGKSLNPWKFGDVEIFKSFKHFKNVTQKRCDFTR